MPEAHPLIEQIVRIVARSAEVLGIAVMVMGAIIATVHMAARVFRGGAFNDAYQDYRGNLGRAILLGLEFLVAADIVGTVAIEPTFRSLGILGLIVLIRTFLSFSLDVEIHGRWPWQEAEKQTVVVDGSKGA
jgi:uncharacterized membrane protein